MNSIRLAAASAAACILLALAVKAAESAPPAKTGIAVGQKAPPFTLKDQNGQDTSLEALLRRGPVALVFHRSADW